MTSVIIIDPSSSRRVIQQAFYQFYLGENNWITPDVREFSVHAISTVAQAAAVPVSADTRFMVALDNKRISRISYDIMAVIIEKLKLIEGSNYELLCFG